MAFSLSLPQVAYIFFIAVFIDFEQNLKVYLIIRGMSRNSHKCVTIIIAAFCKLTCSIW